MVKVIVIGAFWLLAFLFFICICSINAKTDPLKKKGTKACHSK